MLIRMFRIHLMGLCVLLVGGFYLIKVVLH